MDESSRWLVGGSLSSYGGIHAVQGPGLFAGCPAAGSWSRVGHNQAMPFCLLRDEHRLVMGAAHGLYAWQRRQRRWVQLHDETLTEVLAIAPRPGDPGLLAGCPYGVATARRDERGAARWAFHSGHLCPDERFANALLADPADAGRWLVGTEAGVLVYEGDGARTRRSDLADTAVRALYWDGERYWAGTDERGLFSSADGLCWEKRGGDIEGAVYALAAAAGIMLAATQCGVVAGDGTGPWQRLGPRMLFAAIAADPRDPRHWLAGAAPGGLWRSTDAGRSWQQLGHFRQVRAILPPEVER